MVQRYDLAALGTSAHPDNEGHFVKYEDYEHLINCVETLRDMIKAGHARDEHVSGFLEGVLLVAKQ